MSEFAFSKTARMETAPVTKPNPVESSPSTLEERVDDISHALGEAVKNTMDPEEPIESVREALEKILQARASEAYPEAQTVNYTISREGVEHVGVFSCQGHVIARLPLIEGMSSAMASLLEIDKEGIRELLTNERPR